MRVGLTFDLRSDYLAQGWSEDETAEFDNDETIAGLEAALRRQSFDTDRIGNLRALIRRLAAGETWDLVFNIAEGLSGFGREAQVPSVLEAYGIPFTFSDSLVCALSLHKAMTKRVLRDAGVPTADFAVVERAADAAAVRLPYPLLAKPVAEGSSKGIGAASVVRSAAELERRCADLLGRYAQPVLVEAYLPGREFTVGMIGTGAAAEAIAVLEIAVPERSVYSYAYKKEDDPVGYRLADDDEARAAGAAALAAWRVIGARDAGRIDVRLDRDGRPNILELNVLPGLEPGRSDLVYCASRAGWSYDELIGRIVASALRRYRGMRGWTRGTGSAA